MREHTLVLRRVVRRALVAGGILARAAGAQTATVRGVVVDSARTPIPEVAVAVVSAHQATRTDDKGRFRLGKLPTGEVEITIRRIGYEPASLRRTIPPTGVDSIMVVLAELPQVMDAIAVSSAERHRRQGIYRIRAFVWLLRHSSLRVDLRHVHRGGRRLTWRAVGIHCVWHHL